MMYHADGLLCPVCNTNHLILKYEATYEYSYIIDSNAPGLNNTNELLPYMYDSREQKDAKQYLECQTCKTQYPCYFDKWTAGINSKQLQHAISCAYIAKQQLDKK